MTYAEANTIVERMVADIKKKAPPINHVGHFPYLFGGLETRIKFMLTASNLKFKDFDEQGGLKIGR